MGLRYCKWSFRSLRDLFLLLIVVVVLSSMMTFHMSSYLPWLQAQSQFKIHVDGHINIYRSLQLSDKKEEGLRHKSGSNVGKKLMEEHHALYTKLVQLEEQSLPAKKSSVVVIAAGSLSAIKHEVPLLESAFSRFGAKVKFKVIEDEVSEVVTHTPPGTKPSWRVLMCLNTSQPDTCRDTGQDLEPEHLHRMNVIPSLHALLFDPQIMCQGNGDTGQWQRGPLPCYKLLESGPKNPSVPDKGQGNKGPRCGNHTMWVLRSQPGGVRASVEGCQELGKDVNTLSYDFPAVAVQLPPYLFHIGVQPLVMQVHVLVMSFSPLRLYLHSEGLTWEGISSYATKKAHRSLAVSELQQLITDVQGQAASKTMLARLEEAIVKAMLGLETAAVEGHRGQGDNFRCAHSGFQLLEVAAVFNTTFHPFILQIRPYSHAGKLASLNEYLVRQRILEDMAAMVVAREAVVMDVTRGLVELGLTNVYNNEVCNTDQSFCLRECDLIYSLHNRREHLHLGGFTKLYPSAAAVRYTQLLQSAEDGDSVDSVDGDHSVYSSSSSTARLHSYLLGLESYLTHMVEEDSMEAYDDMNVPIDFEGGTNLKARSVNVSQLHSKHLCDNDPASMPYLMDIVTKPHIDLIPDFSPFTTEYKAVVEYEMLLITVFAYAKSCSSQARLEDKHNNNREANFTLGIGENRITIYVVDMSHTDSWVLNTYTLLVERQGPDYRQASFLPGVPHQVCRLVQDCSLRFLKNAPCGLQPMPQETDWGGFVGKKMSLPQCQSGDVRGQWFVPCTDCKDSPSCYWQQALWQPDTCSYTWLPRGKVQKCFAGKKVLFIGDSTNRGILHYITEQVNETLLEWDKTHHLKVYDNINNNNNTTFSFAYYPQFWLPSDHRPVFDKALYQLIKKNIPLENSTNTVLVVGGVHWLAKHHIDVVLKALHRERLTGIQLVVKGLGSGFHQPVSGVHCLTQKDHQRLLSHNQATLTYARQNGFRIVDSFNMTMARYKDFLQGKCACHFHRVAVTKMPSRSPKAAGNEYSDSKLPVYHVEGEINAVYSEMMINEICRSS